MGSSLEATPDVVLYGQLQANSLCVLCNFRVQLQKLKFRTASHSTNSNILNNPVINTIALVMKLHAMNAYEGSAGINLCIISLGTRRG
jgi:hypothetical protein